MRYLLLVGTVLWASLSVAQTQTNCTSTQAGNTVHTNCTQDAPQPLPAMSIAPPVTPPVDPNLVAMAAAAQARRPPSDKKLKKFCKSHPGHNWKKLDDDGNVLAEGTCPR